MRVEPAERLRPLNRTAWLVAGTIWFVWLGVEDRGPGGPLLVAGSGAMAAGLSLLRRWRAVGKASRTLAVRLPKGMPIDERIVWLWQAALTGLAAGAAAAPLGALLMLVKISLHAHPVPDFTLADILAGLQATPAWTLAGLCAGGALGLTVLGLDGDLPRRPPTASAGTSAVQSPVPQEDE